MSRSAAFVAGQGLGAGDLNSLLAAWDTYTPVATNFTVGNGTLTGRFYQQGKTVLLRMNFVAGSTSAYTTSQMALSLPITAHASGFQFFSGRAVLSGSNLLCSATLNTGASTTVVYLESPSSSTNAAIVGMSSSSPNPGTGGYLIFEGVYEAA